jgi:acyl-[acyl-carrier-protein]-phospholipid O-acyltransferase/long-chain-fatty-acid--[acyl-carrier-protein] ligase
LLVTALAVGIGAGVSPLECARATRSKSGWFPMARHLLGLASVLLGFAHSFASSVLWLGIAGFAGGLFIVPLNAFLQEHAEPEEKGRLLATNNFLNMIGVVLASGALYLFHDLLRFSPSQYPRRLGSVDAGRHRLHRLAGSSAAGSFDRLDLRELVLQNPHRRRGKHPKQGAALIVSNHVSYADAILVGCATPRFIRFLMWQPLYENKWLNPFSRLLYAIPIPDPFERIAARAAQRSHRTRKGQLVCIFPEGEITRTSHVKPFERGVDVITRGLESTPVIPVYLDGLWGHALSLKGGRPFSSRLKLRHEVTVYVGEPRYRQGRLPATASARP